jgi:hypothetical protein
MISGGVFFILLFSGVRVFRVAILCHPGMGPDEMISCDFVRPAGGIEHEHVAFNSVACVRDFMSGMTWKHP